MTVLRAIVTFFAALYTLALLAYLLLRVLFGDRFWWLALAHNFTPFFFAPLVALLALAAVLRTRRKGFMLPFALLGALWFGPYFLPKQVPSAGGPTVRVLTFNVWGYNRTPSEIEAWIREVNPDLVFLQEISSDYARDAAPDLLDMYPYQFARATSEGWGGNLTLSPYPIVERQILDLEGVPVQQRLVLDFNGHPLAVYNIHLAFPAVTPRIRLPIDTFYFRTALGYDTRVRNAQIGDLLDILKAEPLPYIVAGDFNTSDQSPIYGELAAVMRDSFREAGMGLGASWPVSRVLGLPRFIPPLIRIDYIWHSDHFRALSAHQGPEQRSDHLPLLATLEIVR
jgi:endonuclease/exonuclease/phosphatase family metal-dependent hydrolase